MSLKFTLILNFRVEPGGNFRLTEATRFGVDWNYGNKNFWKQLWKLSLPLIIFDKFFAIQNRHTKYEGRSRKDLFLSVLRGWEQHSRKSLRIVVKTINFSTGSGLEFLRSQIYFELSKIDVTKIERNPKLLKLFGACPLFLVFDNWKVKTWTAEEQLWILFFHKNSTEIPNWKNDLMFF